MTNIKKTAKFTSVALTLITLTSVSSFANAGSTQSENDESSGSPVIVGAASGATFGALAAGPVGAVVGGLFGIMIGNNHEQDQQLEEAEKQLIASQAALSELNSELIAWQQKAMLQPVSITEVAPQVLPELTTSIQFKTGQSQVESIYDEQLGLVGDMLNSFEGLAVHVTGYADARGSEEDNKALSLNRAEAIMGALIDAGVNQNQISISAMGEKQANVADPQADTIEDYFFDRKAVLTIAPYDKVLTARQSNQF